MSLPAKPKVVARKLQKSCALRPTLAIQLGSGFSSIAGNVKAELEVPYARLPGFPDTRVAGHPGRLIVGKLSKVPILLLCGRAHYYEGFRMAEITFPIRVLARFGIRALLLTNAAGAIHGGYQAGDFMRFSDHINLMGENPLRGISTRKSPPFLDLSRTYDAGLAEQLDAAAAKAKLHLHSGVYLAVSGPSYETPAEIRAFERLGADAVGMSTVPEAIMARRCGLDVAALSCITNAAAGTGNTPVSHEEVLKTGDQAASRALNLLQHFVRIHDRCTRNPAD